MVLGCECVYSRAAKQVPQSHLDFAVVAVASKKKKEKKKRTIWDIPVAYSLPAGLQRNIDIFCQQTPMTLLDILTNTVPQRPDQRADRFSSIKSISTVATPYTMPSSRRPPRPPLCSATMPGKVRLSEEETREAGRKGSDCQGASVR